ncbi:SAM-dependent methyltransferase [Rhodococcus sp. 27YEA15]|uniref:class I SAM-dependent methyltransferase n=1 Tax=Rhodococcus sp. 27YEA15 TaxID=3156259 RepID=UPI003C7AF565
MSVDHPCVDHPCVDYAALVKDWDAQQSAYIAGREQRFDVILDTLELHCAENPFTVVDLACGPGSLGVRILDRFTDASVIGIDHDPMLLELARRSTTRFDDRLTLLDADLLDTNWADAIDVPVHAMVSTTALHWLLPHQLVELYRQVCDVLTPGGVLLNGDHFRFDSRTPVARRWAARHDEQTQHTSFSGGAPTWDAWWETVRAVPGIDALVAERERRFAGRDAPPTTAVDFHVAALNQAGFSESGTVWQFFDDYVVYGVK